MNILRQSKFLFLLLPALLIFFSQTSFALDKFYGKQATEARLSFESRIKLKSNRVITLKDLKRDSASKRWVEKNLYRQIPHLIGLFNSQSFIKEVGVSGVTGELYDIQYNKVLDLGNGQYIVHYSYSGKTVFDRKIFYKGPSVTIPIKLPLSPYEIYNLGVKRGVNHCTDDHYNSEGDFFYFWDIGMKGCPLKHDKVNVVWTEGKLERLNNTKQTYPEYDRLYRQGQALKISVFVGYLNDDLDYVHFPKDDPGPDGFWEMENKIKQLGFKLTDKKDYFSLDENSRQEHGINFLRVYERQVENAFGQMMTVQVEMLLSDTAIESPDATFHKYLTKAFESSQIVAYDGHSGLGGNLDIESLPEFKLNPGLYQIFFFNGCSSYPYFNGQFFRAKGGSENLEIITAGTPTLSDTAADNMLAVLNNFLTGDIRSYQLIMDSLERSNGETETYLMGVNGDEDNQWQDN